VLTAVPDDVIIDRSVRCPKCGELYVPMKWIFTAIRLSPTVEEFLNLTDGHQAHLHEYVDEYIEDLSYHLRPSGYSHPYGLLGPPTTYSLEDLPEENLFEDE